MKIFLFVFLTFLFSSFFYFFMPDNSLIMFCPAIGAILTLLITERRFLPEGLGINKKVAIYGCAMVILPLLLNLVTYSIVWFGWGKGFDLTRLVPADFEMPAGISKEQLGIFFLFYQLVIGILLNGVFTLGEELGWRGVLVPEMAKKMEFVKVGLISGLIWAVWHWPLIIRGDYHEGNILFSLIIFTLDVVMAGFIYAFVRLKSASIWPVVILHAVVNTSVQGIFDPITIKPDSSIPLVGEFGIVNLLSTFVVALIIYVIIKRGQKKIA